MKTIDLLPGIETSVLGFGCASIGGAVSKKAGREALDVSYDSGIRYFDVAPSYGFGEAELVLGQFLKGKRERCVVTTKFGIRANRLASLARPLKGIVRAVRGSRTSNPGRVGPPRLASADRFHERLPLTPKEMLLSFQSSLWKLQTDFIDGLMLHEPAQSVAHFEDLVVAANRLKEQGKLRFFGIAAWAEQLSLHREYLDSIDVLQLSPPEIPLEERRTQPNVLFSVFQGQSGDRRLRLQELSATYTNSVILFSSFNREHIQANARM